MKKTLTYFIFFIFIIVSNLFSNELIKKVNSVDLNKLNVNLKSGGSIYITGKQNTKQIILKISSDKTISNEDVKISRNNDILNVILANISRDNLKIRNIKIFVPLNFNLKLKTSGGNIIIKDLNGKVSGKTSGGNIKISGMKGSAVMKTSGGDIVLSDSNLKGKLHTMGGNIVFDNIEGDIEGKTMGGNVIYRNKKDVSSKNNKYNAVKIDTMGGDIDINKAPFGADVKTMGGNIDIRSAKHFIKAETMGGNIIIDSIKGSSDALTMGGNIKVRIDQDSDIKKYNSNLRSMNGDITIYIPKSLSILIDSEIIISDKNNKKHKILSDFKIEIKKSQKISKNGIVQKTIKGNSKIKNGKNKIILRTKNGSIYIKESKGEKK